MFPTNYYLCGLRIGLGAWVLGGRVQGLRGKGSGEVGVKIRAGPCGFRE